MQEVGDFLRSEREFQGISLEELARTTRIPSKNLSLLEQNRLPELPGNVFVKGYIRAVAKSLGTDPEPLLEQLEPVEEIDSEPPPAALVAEPERGRRFGMAMVVAVLLILFTLALSIVLQPRQRNTPVELSSVLEPATALRA